MQERGTAAPVGAGKLGMWLLIASLSMLFGAALIGYILIRQRAASWPPPGMPGLPSGMWLSTLVILASSATMQLALTGIRNGVVKRLRSAMTATLVLGLAFLVNQSMNWFGPVARQINLTPNLYAFTYYMLTVLHAAHVVGGLIPMGIVQARAGQGRYTAASHSGVEYLAMYWHFLTVTWLVIFAVLLIAG